jgi:hypothetical protein
MNVNIRSQNGTKDIKVTLVPEKRKKKEGYIQRMSLVLATCHWRCM